MRRWRHTSACRRRRRAPLAPPYYRLPHRDTLASPLWQLRFMAITGQGGACPHADDADARRRARLVGTSLPFRADASSRRFLCDRKRSLECAGVSKPPAPAITLSAGACYSKSISSLGHLRRAAII